MGEPVNISKLVKVIRSKNAGPFMFTLDLFFEDEEAYKRVKESGVLTRELIARLYHTTPKEVTEPIFVDDVMGIKVTIIRPGRKVIGDPGYPDTFGMQQHVPLLSIKIP